ncbi:MAG: ERCC4 domain-containing protein [Candidatus Micrarchaeia archaeon]
MLKIIVDDRERNDTLLKSLREKDIEIATRRLPIGDYIVSDRVCVERKTISDFEKSLIDGRLFEQIKRLKEYYEFPILVIEGREEFRLKRSTINGAIARIYINYNVVSVAVDDEEGTAEFIAALARQEQQIEHREPSLKGNRKAYTGSQFQEYVVGNLPGVGPKTAKALLKYFGNIKRIANASTEELMRVENIGRKKSEQISRVLNEKYDESV